MTKEPVGLTVLNVGTQILARDLMDQYIRTLGPHRTHYAQGIRAARRLMVESPPDIVISEFEYSDGTAFDLVRALRETLPRYAFLALAVQTESPELKAAARELYADSILSKPFNALGISKLFETYQARIVFAGKESPDVQQFRALLAARGRDYPQAEKLHEAAIANADDVRLPGPDVARLHVRYGRYWMEDRPHLDRAEKHLALAVQADPSSVAASSALGELYLRKRDYKRALTLLADAQTDSPLNPERPVLLSRALVGRASEELRKALLRYPQSAGLQLEQARVLVHQHDYAPALALLRSLKMSPTDQDHREVQVLIQVCQKLGALQ